MKKTFFCIIIYTAAVLPLSLKAEGKALPCASGGICVAVQENADGSTKVSFNDFVHIDDVDGYYMRVIEEKEGLTGPTQVQNAVDQIMEQDQTLGKMFESAVTEVQKVDARRPTKGNKLKSKIGSWARHTVAIFNPSRKKFVVDTDLYGKLQATDSAGVILNMACQKVAMEKNIPSYQFVNCERLARRLFCDDDCYKAVADYTKSSVPTMDERKAKIKYMLGMFVPPVNNNNNGSPVNSNVNQNLARGSFISNAPGAPARENVRQNVQQAQANPPPVINNMPPIPPTPAGANPWIAPQYQQTTQTDAQAQPAPVPGSDMTGVQQADPQAQQQQQQPQQSAEVQMPPTPDGQVQQQQQPPPGT